MQILFRKLICCVVIFIPFVCAGQNITRGPYLQAGSKTSITIRWRTDVPTDSRVGIGTTAGSYPISVTDNNNVTEHIIQVSGLNPNTKYYYTTGTTSLVLQGDAQNFFVTAPADSSKRKITAAVFGDCGRNDNNYQTNSLARYQNYLQNNGLAAADLMLLLGDNAYPNGTDAEYTTGFFMPYENSILKNHILFPAPGNHEYANNAARQDDHNIAYYDIFTVPTGGQSGGIASNNEAYYSYDWGNIHFLSLDSYGEEDAGTTRLYDTNGTQVQWIKADLAANTKKWTIAYWHHPPYTMGSHNSDTENDLVAFREKFIQILERNGVDLILCGHSHNYERSYLLNGYYGNENSFSKASHTRDSSSGRYDGSTQSCPYTYKSGKYQHGTVYVVAGSAGASGSVQAGYPHNALPFAYNDGGMLMLEIEDNRLDARFIRQDGVIADKFTIMKDVNRRDTVYIAQGNSINLRASWLGGYTWSNAAANRQIVVSPAANTTYTVKDSATNTCLQDTIAVKVFPANIAQHNKQNIKLYPVPGNDVLNLVLPDAASMDVTINIISLTGQTLQSTTSKTDNGGSTSIDISRLPANQQLLLKVYVRGIEQTAGFSIMR
ncbi:hypothetical protein CAP35_06830 [Chitinophagaceae bacterium IBVUCB1]|nr:hypothetical protein CAP35_06830 [Chitinophagaceae bacterium IBVUCB1]